MLRYIKYLLIVVFPSLLLWAILQGYLFSWTGFNGKTLWDWMDLFIIPLVLSIGAFSLNYSERKSERQQAEERRKVEHKQTEERAKLEREIAIDRQREEALQTYIDRMSDLLIKDKLRTTKNKEIRNVARTRTLSVLRGLDGKRKGLLIKFLYESQLISNRKTIIDLYDADLSEAYLIVSTLKNINLKGANLKKVDFSFAILDGADLSDTNLLEADFTRANLSNVDLTSAVLGGANFNKTNLNGAKVTKVQLENVKV